MPQPLLEQRRGGIEAIVGQRDEGVAELPGIGAKPDVMSVRAIAGLSLARGKELRRELAPGLGQLRIDRHGPAECGERLRAVAGCRIGATELELHERGVGVRVREALEHRHRFLRVAEPAGGSGEQQARLRVSG